MEFARTRINTQANQANYDTIESHTAKPHVRPLRRTKSHQNKFPRAAREGCILNRPQQTFRRHEHGITQKPRPALAPTTLHPTPLEPETWAITTVVVGAQNPQEETNITYGNKRPQLRTTWIVITGLLCLSFTISTHD